MNCRTLPALVVVAFIAAACSDNTGQRTAASAEGNAPASTQTAQAGPNEVTFVARDFVFEGPTEIPAGVTTIRLVNQGPELHHASLLKLEEGKTATDYVNALKAGGPPPTWAKEMGGPNAPAPGDTANATQRLEAGNYAFVCFVDTPDQVPHMMKGMVHNFRVTPSNTPPAPEPQPTVVMRLDDYKFDLSQPLKAGQHTFKVENVGPQHHEVELIQLAPGKTPQDVLQWIHKPQGPPPGKPIGGIAGMDPGVPAYFTATLQPGEYALICFLPDHKDGKPHFQHGMMQTIRVS